MYVSAYNGKTYCTFSTMCNNKNAIILVVFVIVNDLYDAVNKSLINRSYISVVERIKANLIQVVDIMI